MTLAKERLQRGPVVPKSPFDDERLIAQKREYARKKTVELDHERFVCDLCDKMFKGPLFVEKHVFNK